MPITVEERFRGRSGSRRGRDIVYLVCGTDDDSTALTAAANTTPAFWDGLIFDDVRLTQLADDKWAAAAVYKEPEKKERDPPEQGTVEYAFSYRATSEHIYQAISVVQEKEAPTESAALDSQGAINIVLDGGEMRVEGVQLPVPPVTDTWTYYPVNAVVTESYQAAVAGIMGHVNTDTFMGRPAGTMRFVGCQGGVRTNDDWQIGFEFSYSPNLTGITRGAITGINKGGHEYLWFYYRDGMDSAGRIKHPTSAHVVQVFEESAFSILGLE